MTNSKPSILLFNPPGELYQRSEDRCQANIKGSATISLRAANDLGIMAAVARQAGFRPFLCDYMAEGKTAEAFMKDIKSIQPNIVVMSCVTATLLHDMSFFRAIKEHLPSTLCIAKGAYFATCKPEMLEKEAFLFIDFAFTQEAEVVLKDFLAIYHANKNKPIDELRLALQRCRSVLYWEDTALLKMGRTEPLPFLSDLDSLPFPARDLMNNALYLRPDTGELQATIQTSRGCPASCIYCLTPTISGKEVRKRSAKNIVDEIEECLTQYHIRNFFFRADTFTIDKEWVHEVCEEILTRGLDIEWVANSRVKPLQLETLQIMKKAGCWLLALGIESGSEKSLQKMKKGAQVADAYEAVRLCKKAKMKSYGFYLIGFPWETKEDIQETITLALQLDCDFSEFHLATPYEGTGLYEITKKIAQDPFDAIGHNYFTEPVRGTDYLTKEELLALRDEGMKRLYLRPSYILRTLLSIRSLSEFINYGRYGLRLIGNLIS